MLLTLRLHPGLYETPGSPVTHIVGSWVLVSLCIYICTYVYMYVYISVYGSETVANYIGNWAPEQAAGPLSSGHEVIWLLP